MASVYIGLGSNIGRREENLRRAVKEMNLQGIEVIRASRIYETRPVGFRWQPRFLNMVVEARTELDPFECLKRLQRIEAGLGRRRWFKNCPRRIDLDILLYGQAVVRTEELVIPHPRLYERPFFLFPLHELAPRLRHPGLKVSITELLSRLDRSGMRLWKNIAVEV